MILVCDSGSTKADWMLAKHQQVIGTFSTMGLNPFFHTADDTEHALMQINDVQQHRHGVRQVHFFGAGCSHPSRNAIIAQGLCKVFPHAAVNVQHDLDAAAYATCGDHAGIACILGTGSNSCYFDGTRVHELQHGLGYIIGDEGSGSYYGRKLLAYYLYKVMPEDLRQAFYDTFKVTKESIMQHVYKMPNVNVFLASHSPFLSAHAQHPFIVELVNKGMGEFLDVNVCNIPQHREVPVHFIGSIAYHFSHILIAQATSRALTVGNIIPKPIDSLTQYFIQKEIAKA